MRQVKIKWPMSCDGTPEEILRSVASRPEKWDANPKAGRHSDSEYVTLLISRKFEVENKRLATPKTRK